MLGIAVQQLAGQFQLQAGEAFGTGQNDGGQANGFVKLRLAESREFLGIGKHGYSWKCRYTTQLYSHNNRFAADAAQQQT